MDLIFAGFLAPTKSRSIHSEGMATRRVRHDFETRVNLLQKLQQQSSTRREYGSYTNSSNRRVFIIISMISNGRILTGLTCTSCNFNLLCTSFSFLMEISAYHIASGARLGSSHCIELKYLALCAFPSHRCREPFAACCRAVGFGPYEGNP